MSREAMALAIIELGNARDYIFLLPENQQSLTEDEMLKKINAAITALRQALETEPFEYWNAVEGWVKIDEVREHFDAVGCGTIYKSAGEGRSPLYTAPQKKEWVGLTDEEVQMFIDARWSDGLNFTHFIRAIEAKLKEKNHG